MQCITCKVEIQPAFKHAVAKNECPACGGQILDEESLALIEDVERAISAEVQLREGTANKLAVALVTRYSITLKGDQPMIPVGQPMMPMARPRPQAQMPAQMPAQQVPMRTAPPSYFQQMQQVAEGESIMHQPAPAQVYADGNNGGTNVVKLADLPQGISDAEREEIMTEMVSKRYGLVEGISAVDNYEPDVSGLVDPSTVMQQTSPFSEGNANPILEAERLHRLAKQQMALRSGSGAFRR